MAISVKSKFAGFLRGLIGRADPRQTAPGSGAAAPSAPPASAPALRATPIVPPSAATPRAANPDVIELPLTSIVACLPLDLRAKLMAAPPASQTIHLQADQVIGQLAFGAVKISFGELRHLAPGVFVNSGGELDNKLVNLPLQEILPRLNPALLARRPVKKVQVADDITGPFANRGRGFSFTTQALKAPPAPPTPAPQPDEAPAHSIAFVPPISTRQVSPSPQPSQFPQRSITPAAPTNGTHGSAHSSPPVSPLAPRNATPPPSNGNGNGHANGLTLPPGLRIGSMNGNRQAETPPMKMSAVPAPEPVTPSPAPARPAPAQPTLFVSLSELCENWPEALKAEILSSPLAQTNVPLDGAIILPGMKRGRVVITWKQIRVAAQPSSAASSNDNLELELPLKIIAPLFLAAQKGPSRLQVKASVSSDIPDLFFGFPQPAPAPAPAAPVAAPLPKAPEKPQDTNYYVWGEKGEAPQADEAALRRGEAPQTDFLSRQTHPKEVVQRAVELPGVAGSVVAMQDGLRVASQTPADLNPDTLAAFLPQIFERLNQSTRELRMGALNNVNFTVGNIPWKIFRVNAVYFAAFGRANEPLPGAPLAALAVELDHKK